MDDRDFLQAVVDYVELTDSMLSEKRTPAFKKEAIDKTASALIGASLIRPDEAGVLSEAFSKDPNRALDVLQKVAERYKLENAEAGDSRIGSPVGDKRPSSRPDRESDRVFLERFKLV